MNLFEFIPEKNVKKLRRVVSACLLGAAALVAVTAIFGEMAYRWAVQLLAIALLMMGVFITSRYIMKSYVYAVMRTERGDDLTVTEIQGRHRITVCRIALDGIERIIVVEQGDKQTDAQIKQTCKEQKRKRFNYCADLLDEKYICVFANECAEPLAIKLSWGEQLEKILGDVLSERCEEHGEREQWEDTTE
jgi:hypothetical protein